ncbi:MAG: GNAT family N-acetyltransferase [Mangrovibacterium sp.]
MDNPITFRTAKPSDLENILRLEEICFAGESFSRGQLRYLIGRAKADFIIAGSENTISAFIVLLRRRNTRNLRIYSIAVSPEERGKGLARALLAEAEKNARSTGKQYINLEVGETNQDAIRLYLRSGFEVFGERASYYRDGSKALLMRRPVL